MSEHLTTRWWWIRHAPVTTDQGCVYGQTDAPADFSDHAAFSALAAILPPEAVWVSSQLSRARGTAAAIAAAGLPAPAPLIEPDLAEQHFGEWQGQPRHELFANNAEWHRFWLAPADTTAPGGESFTAVIARVGRAVSRLTAAHAGRDIVATAHGGTIRAALAIALDLEPDRALAFSTDNLSITRLDHIANGGIDGTEEAWRVVAVNLLPTDGGGTLASSIVA